MKKVRLLAALIAVLSATSLSALPRSSWYRCNLSCSSGPAYVSTATLAACCNTLHLCADGSYSVGEEWLGDGTHQPETC